MHLTNNNKNRETNIRSILRDRLSTIFNRWTAFDFEGNWNLHSHSDVEMVCGSLRVGRNCLDAVMWTIVYPRCHFLRTQLCLSYPELVSLKYCIYLYVSIYDPTCQATDENHWYGWLCATSYLLMSAIVSIFGAHFCRWWDPSVFLRVVNVRTTHKLISWQHNIHSIDRIYQTTSQECKSRPETTEK